MDNPVTILCFVAGNVAGWFVGGWIGDKIIERMERKRMLKTSDPEVK